MARIKKHLPMMVLLSILLAAIAAATLVTAAFGGLLPRRWLPLFFSGFLMASVFVWYWFVFIRPAELKKRLPITSKEREREQDEFYKSLPR